MGVIQDEDIFAAADLVGGINHLRRIFNDDTKITDTIDSLKGTLNLIYHSRKEFMEFPMKFEIIGKKENIARNNSWPVLNLTYDDSNLSKKEKELFEQFLYDSISDLNVEEVNINPNARKMFRDQNYVGPDFVNGRHWEELDHEEYYHDKDMKKLYLKYMEVNHFGVNESRQLNENEEDPTKKILNFLRRRSEVEEKNLGGEEYPINFKILRIYIGDGTWNNITRFENKKDQVRRILNILMDNRIIDRFEFNETRYNPYAQQAIRAVKTFLNQVM